MKDHKPHNKNGMKTGKAKYPAKKLKLHGIYIKHHRRSSTKTTD